MKFSQIIEEIVLLEYSKGLINGLVNRYKGENPNLDSEEIVKYIVRFGEIKDSPQISVKDIRKYDFRSLVKVVDNYRSKRIKAGTIESEPIDANLLYNKDGIRMYVGNTKKACIKYGNGFSFCISSRGEMNMYDDYRFIQRGTPFFVFNDNPMFHNPEHEFLYNHRLIVIFVYADKKGRVKKYSVTDASNNFEEFYGSLDDIINDFPWVSNLKDYLRIYELDPSEEKDYYNFIKTTLTRRLNSALQQCVKGEDIKEIECDNFHNREIEIDRFVNDKTYCIHLNIDGVLKMMDENDGYEKLDDGEVSVIINAISRSKLCLYTHDIDEQAKKEFIVRQTYMFDYETKSITRNNRSENLVNSVEKLKSFIEQNIIIDNVTRFIHNCVRSKSSVVDDFIHYVKGIKKES